MFCGNNWTEAFENKNNTIYRNSSFATNDTFTVIFRSDSFLVSNFISIHKKNIARKYTVQLILKVFMCNLESSSN